MPGNDGSPVPTADNLVSCKVAATPSLVKMYA